MIKKTNGLLESFPKRPQKNHPFNWANDITSKPQSGGKNPTFKQRLRAAKTGYLSLPSHLSDELKKEILERVRLQFPHIRVGSFATEFENTKDWRNHLKSFISDIDVLIVAHDRTRTLGLGVRKEMNLANTTTRIRYLGFLARDLLFFKVLLRCEQ